MFLFVLGSHLDGYFSRTKAQCLEDSSACASLTCITQKKPQEVLNILLTSVKHAHYGKTQQPKQKKKRKHLNIVQPSVQVLVVSLLALLAAWLVCWFDCFGWSMPCNFLLTTRPAGPALLRLPRAHRLLALDRVRESFGGSFV